MDASRVRIVYGLVMFLMTNFLVDHVLYSQGHVLLSHVIR